MRAFTKLVVLATLSLVIAGCASIPLATALSLSSMGPRKLAQVDPAQVVVRVSVPIGFEIDVPATRLGLQLKSNGSTNTAAMALSAVSVSRTVRAGGLFSPDTRVSTYLLRLTPEAARELQASQRFIVSSNPREFEFTLNAPFSKVPPNVREVKFWADLRLSLSEPFKPLIDGATVRFDAAKAGS